LITKKECTKAKEKLYETAGRTVDDLSVPGCRKDQKLIAKKKKQKKTATKKKKLSIYEQVENGTKKIDDLSAAEWPEYIAERNRRQKKNKKKQKATGLAAKLESIEQEYNDGLITVIECKKAKQRIWNSR
jgi:hypothetical protein